MPPDIEDIAESIEEVRGGPLAISALCLGAVAAIGTRVLTGDFPEDFVFTTESDTLREDVFES